MITDFRSNKKINNSQEIAVTAVVAVVIIKWWNRIISMISNKDSSRLNSSVMRQYLNRI